MTVAPAPTTTELKLDQLFPGEATPDARKGYSGYIVKPDKLVEVATALRDQHGYDYCSSVTGVDYLEQGQCEAVYHLYNTKTGGPAVVIKAQAPRDNAVLPSLTPVWPGADFQEREAWDLYGIKFTGHPDLKRILMWEGFHGHPMRKDWKEAYYEQEGKPFDARWPGGQVHRSEEKNPFGHNVAYPEGFTLEGWSEQADKAVYDSLPTGGHGSTEEGMRTDLVTVNLGPQHPSTHGVFRIVATLDGETIVKLEPVMGYLHRNHEKIGERNTFIQNIPFTDRLDYITSMSNNHGYVLAVEKLMGLKPPERAEYLRVMMVELTRIVNHTWAIGFLLNDLGAFFTPVLYVAKERELILDVFEATAGSRMMCNYMRFGGVSRDITPEAFQQVKDMVYDRLPRLLDEIDTYLTNSEIVRTRSIGVGVLSAADAAAYSVGGPVLRASGVAYDVRKAEPYSIYDRFDFNTAVRYQGDNYDRYLVRLDECRESLKILRQVCEQMPAGEIQAGKPQYQARVPAGEAYGRVENPKGELGYYVISTGKANAYRYHVRAPSFINLTPFGKMSVGHKIADVVAILGSIDIVLGEVDR
ncbi:MAG: NADH-quinone oxidoreductase subunit D [Anaerolineales bacterium]|nr:NADH-quinone oxidoreductase subunit D [Anaerolineales bacterium]